MTFIVAVSHKNVLVVRIVHRRVVNQLRDPGLEDCLVKVLEHERQILHTEALERLREVKPGSAIARLDPDSVRPPIENVHRQNL